MRTFSPDELLEIRQMVLDRLEVSVQEQWPAVAPLDFPMEVFAEQVAGRLRLRLSGYVLAEKLADDTHSDSIEVPATWWQHFKRDMTTTRFGRWWLRRRFGRYLAERSPVVMRTEVLKVRWTRAATRPMSELRDPNNVLGPVFYVEQMSPVRYWT